MSQHTHNYKENRWDEAQSLAADVDDTFHGRVLASFETGANPLCFDWLVADHPGPFLKLIAHFPDRERTALIQRYLLGHSQPQRAALLGVSEFVVCSDLERAHRRLRQGDPQPLFKGRLKGQTEVRKIDPDCLGQFRVSVRQVEELFHDPSQIRITTTPEHDIP